MKADDIMHKENLKVLFVSSEVSPYIKSGGLGEVAGSLPLALKELGVDIRVVFPRYKTINQSTLNNIQFLGSFEVKLDWRLPQASILSIDAPYPTYLVENGHYFDRGHIYGFGDDFERFAFFSKAAINMLPIIDFKPDIIHFNDWQTAIGCIYLKDIYSRFLYYSDIKSIFTIHNLQYQGHFGSEVLPQIDLNYGYFVNDKLEFHNIVNYMKGGLAYADYVTTVSPTYAHEIQSPTYSYGLDGIIRSRADNLIGILNGIDYNEYNPETDSRIPFNYNVHSLDNKANNKSDLQAMLGLPVRDVPMFAIISRLAEQKGLDLVAAAMGELMNRDIQLVVLGTGDEHFEHLFTANAYYHPDKVSANIRFDASFAQKIYAASDFFLMPSLFEPCGLGQLIAMHYGSLPICRKTGGLVDTVQHYNYDEGTGVGILFEHYVSNALIWAIDEAIHLYSEKSHYRKAQINAMSKNFSWEQSAKDYTALYEKVSGIKHTPA